MNRLKSEPPACRCSFLEEQEIFMTDREAMERALGALTRIWEDGLENYPSSAHADVIAALRERLAQPEQEPVISDYHEGWEEGFKAAKKEWQGLTYEEIKHEWLVWRANSPRYVGFAKGVENKLREKNT